MKQICLPHYLQTFTAKVYFLFFLVWQTQQAFAQFQDDFSDRDFSVNPTWTGDDSLFKIVDSWLQLSAPEESNVAYLSTPSTVSQFGSWEFAVRLSFNPSASNFAKVYLIADQSDLSEPLNGYFIMVGSSADDVCLYQQTGPTSKKLIDGRDGILNLSGVSAKINVIRSADGWQLFTKSDTTETYTLEGSSDDNTLTESNYFGIVCAYTATRSDKFAFDDFNVQKNEIKDTDPPGLTDLEVLSSQNLKLTFSEPLDQTSATSILNFSVNHDIGTPALATLQENQNVVEITFEKTFPENAYATLSISGIMDVSGNIMESIQKDFTFVSPVQISYKDVIITEIFADPSPSVGLPSFEFVELHNRSTNSFDLSGWTLTDGSSISAFPDFVLLTNEYVVLTPSNTDFPNANNILKLPNFPTLNNANDVLILKDEKGHVIDSVNYFLSWYRDDDKAEGGYSLEIIDPNNICSEHENWSASENEQGGTPGLQNSIFANKPDLIGPALLAAVPISATEIQLNFDERLERQLPDLTAFSMNPLMMMSKVSFLDTSYRSLRLKLTDALQPGIQYTLSTENIYDCSGNVIQPGKTQIDFGLPQEADSLDVLINEILFNPRPTGVDFVEIINNTQKYFNLKDWSIATINAGELKEKTSLISEDFLFKPGAFLALTEDPDILKGEYLLSQEKNFVTVKNLPAFHDDEGSVVLMDSANRIIDYFTYTKDMHSVFIKDDEGVSLERISTLSLSDGENWRSASSSVGFATPGYANSNAIVENAISSTTIHVDPEIFNPLQGQRNFALISYNVDHGGYVANVRVFSAQGHLVKEIANNDILGTAGFYRWDGDRDDGTKANVGYYMIWFEIFDEHGSVRQYQKRVAIAGTF